MAMLDPTFLFASVIWGAIGTGFLVYGTRQKSLVPAMGGILMIVASYFATSALLMSVVCFALAVAVYLLLRQGY
jgi:hypothetical protein